MASFYNFTSDALDEISEFADALKDAVDDFNNSLEELTEDKTTYPVKMPEQLPAEKYNVSGSYGSYLEAAADCRKQLGRMVQDLQQFTDREKQEVVQQALVYNRDLLAAVTGYPEEFRRTYDSLLREHCRDTQAVSYLNAVFQEFSLPLQQLSDLAPEQIAARLSAMNFARLSCLDVCVLYPYCDVDDDDGAYYFDLEDAYGTLWDDICDNFLDMGNDFAPLFSQDIIERTEPVLETIQLILDDLVTNAEYFEA